MLEKLIDIFRYHGPIPQSILLRASTLASLTKTYIAFDADGTCYMYPVPPMKLPQSKVWIPRGRKGMFQREEIRFTYRKYRYTNWDILICPSDTVNMEFTHSRYNPTRVIRKTEL